MSPHQVEDVVEDVPRESRASWKEASVYQIYPASFKDSTGSGFGDLKGVISKVDYLQRLGVDIVWLCPIFGSPLVDMGYDISDYRSIDSRYGSVEDVVLLKEKLHERGMKLVLDLVVNHTSDQHEWFKKSQSSKDSEYRDWYLWRPPKYDVDGQRLPPNNWKSHFQGDAWEYDEKTGEYYLHLFATEQPDLNWDNPAVRQQVHEIMRFWLDLGIDGFRLDVINFISKDQSFQDSPNSVLAGSELYAAGPRLHEYLQELGAILQEYDAFSVGEMPCVQDPKEIIKAVRSDRNELSMIFHFEIMDIDHGNEGKFSPKEWKLSELKRLVNKWQQFMYKNDGWNALYLENHDQPRSVSRFANDSKEFRTQSAKMLAVFLALQSGTPFIYQGQELGMHNIPEEWPMDEYKDIDCLNHWSRNKDVSDEARINMLRREYRNKSRDNARTPMQWDSSAQAGFTTAAQSWMSPCPCSADINAEAQLDDPRSVFNIWRTVLATRKAYKDIIVYGDFQLVDEANETIFAYLRTAGEDKVLVVCNFSKEVVPWGGLKDKPAKVLLTTTERESATLDGQALQLAPFEALAFLL